MLHIALIHFAENLVDNILHESFNEMLFVINNAPHSKSQSISAFVEKLIVSNTIPIIQLFDHGLLNCSLLMSKNLKFAAEHKQRYNQEENTIAVFAENLCSRVFRDVFVHFLSNIDIYHDKLKASYKHIPKNGLPNFAEKVIEEVFRDALNLKENCQQNHVCNSTTTYCETVANDIMSLSLHEASKNLKAGQQKRNSIPTLSVVKEYATELTRNMFWDSSQTLINKTTSTYSSSSSLLTVNRSDSFEEICEAISPRSAADDSHWKRGIYLFADQLLYSLTALESEEVIDENEVLSIRNKRVRRWGSCPHILRKPFPIKRDLFTNRRKSETVVCTRRSVATYADTLSRNILKSLTSRSFVF